MTKHQFYLSLLIVFVAFVVLGPIGYFSYKVSIDQHDKQVKIEQERTQRSKGRWETADKMLKRLPFIE